MDSSAKRGLPIGALILIALGLLFLLQNLGLVPWSLWAQAWRLWPVLLILIGLKVLFGQRSPVLAGLLSLVVVVGAILWLAFNRDPVGFTGQTVQFSDPRGAVRRLQADLDFGAGRLKVSALPPGADRAWEGVFKVSARRGVHPAYSVEEGVGRLKVKPADGLGFVPFAGANEWTLRFAPDVDLGLDVSGGAGELDLDLSGLRLASLGLNLGAAEATVRLPSTPGVMRVEVNAGAAEIEITVPQDVDARIGFEGAVSNVTVAGRFKRLGGYYISDGYDTAERKADIDISAGAADITVR